MASDPTAGGAPAEMPVEPSDPNLDIPPKPEGVAAECEQLQAEKADLQDKLLRALAEAQNVRRRGQQDVERERKFGIERFAKDILSVADNLGRALSALPGDAESIDPALRNVIVGVQATERELQSVLERHGVTRIEVAGQAVQRRVPSGDDGSRGPVGAGRHRRPGADPGLPDRRPPAARGHGGGVQGRPGGPAPSNEN